MRVLLPAKLELIQQPYRVYKTGIAFYDAARLIGVAHLFLGTASAEVEDKGAYWEVRGIQVNRDEEQGMWAVERLNPTDTEWNLFYRHRDHSFQWDDFQTFFSEADLAHRSGRKEALKAEYDAALQIGTRGFDSLAKYEVLAPRSTGETRKKFKDFYQEVAAATLGRAFAARVTSRTKRQSDEMYVLPVFKRHFVLSGFLDYQRSFNHSAGGWVAAVFASLSILLDLTAKRLPVADFVYTREVKGPTRQPIFSGSGYLGFERLCNFWRRVVQEGDEGSIELLRNIRSFLSRTTSPQTNEQVQSLARWVADFVANPNVDSLTMIERLKARILAASQSQNIPGAFAANQFLNWSEIIKEVGKMVQIKLPEVPEEVGKALAHALFFFDRKRGEWNKGWMNQLTRMENAPNFSQFIQQAEHIISRGYYREQQEKGQQPNIRDSLTQAKSLANRLKEMSGPLQDDKTFRAWKAVFLLDVLSRARAGGGQPEGQKSVTEGVPSESESQTSKGG